MEKRRLHILSAGALVLATALAGVAARGAGREPAPPGAVGKTNFAAPTTGPVSFTGKLDRTAVLLGHDPLARLELVIAGAPDSDKAVVRRPTDLVIILDRSGSMVGDKIDRARAAVRELVTQLGPQDRFALVTYSDNATVAVPLTPVDETARSGWFGIIAEIQTGGGTNMSSGLDLGIALIEQARAEGRVPHAILISDGLANQGDSTQEGLVRRAKRAAQGEYTLSTAGVGTDFNEYLMTALADAGTGNYYYVKNSTDLTEVFAREFDAARTTIATGLAVRIEPGAGIRVVDAAGYPIERSPAGGVEFHPGSLFAGQERRIWVTLAIPEDTLGEYDLGRFSLSYGDHNDRVTLSFAETPHIACVKNEDQFYSSIDRGVWGRMVVVEDYNKMKQDVARDVSKGRRAEALHRLREFKDQTAALNAHVQSAPVAQQLLDVDKLEADVSAAFEGNDQVQRQNELSKAASAGAVDARRAGSKK